MSEIFGPIYAGTYDSLYKDKNYDAECKLLKDIFKKYGKINTRKILDLGCGTGCHAIPLSRDGFDVTGVDLSEDMISTAKAKAEIENLSIEFRLDDIRQLCLGRTFDAVLMMFAVLGYQLENKNVLASLKSARTHLPPSGLLVFDVWYGPAVISQRPAERIKIISESDRKILRVASGELDTRYHICKVSYHLWQLDGNVLESEVTEEHKVRFFFPLELELFLDVAGFDLVRLSAFPEADKDPDESTWNVIGVAIAR